MKRLLFAVAGLVLGFGTSAQTPTIVSTDSQNRNVVIEEYTGINCTWCPDGHKMVQEFADNNPGRVIPINIHTGGFANGVYTTNYGTNIEAQASVEGYPSGSVNRNVSGCKVIAYGRDRFAPEGRTIMSQTSPVNIAATATIDCKTLEVKVYVEAYYTANVNQKFNMLNIALLQNNILGQQTGMDKNPAQVVDGKYKHNHMFRDFLTGQWGDTIGKNDEGVITAGTFFSKTYTYTLPEKISNENVVMGDLDFVVFVADGEVLGCSSLNAPNIWTGISVEPEYTNMEGAYASMTNLQFSPIPGCVNLANLSLNVRNIAGDELNFIKFEYTNEAAGDTKTFTWSGNLTTFKSTNIAFTDPITVETGKESTIKVKIVELNRVAPAEPIEVSGKYTKPAPKEGNGKATVIIRTDKKANEVSWFVYNSEGETIAQSKAYPSGEVVRDTVLLDMLTTVGCYTFEIKDAGNDGVDGGQYKIITPNKKTIISNTSLKGMGAGEMADFKIIGFEEVGLNEANENIFQSIVYPNPAKDVATLSVNLVNSDNATISVVDLMGREVINLGEQSLKSGENQININTSSLNGGLYYVRVVTNNGMVTNKLNIVK